MTQRQNQQARSEPPKNKGLWKQWSLPLSWLALGVGTTIVAQSPNLGMSPALRRASTWAMVSSENHLQKGGIFRKEFGQFTGEAKM